MRQLKDKKYKKKYVEIIHDDIDNYTDAICFYLKKGYSLDHARTYDLDKDEKKLSASFSKKIKKS